MALYKLKEQEKYGGGSMLTITATESAESRQAVLTSTGLYSIDYREGETGIRSNKILTN